MRSVCSLSSSIAARLTWPELLDVGARLGQLRFPGRHVGFRGERREHLGELEARLGELLGERLAPHAGLLRGKPRLLHRLARLVHALLGRQALLVERAQLAFRVVEQLARRARSALDLQALLERLAASRPCEPADRLIARGQLLLELAAPPGELLALLGHACQADRHRAFRGAARLHLHEQVARGELRALRAGAGRGERFAALLALAFEDCSRRIELAERGQRRDRARAAARASASAVRGASRARPRRPPRRAGRGARSIPAARSRRASSVAVRSAWRRCALLDAGLRRDRARASASASDCARRGQRDSRRP